jgi:PadR family transcriptional regulator, regulatory protein AphA
VELANEQVAALRRRLDDYEQLLERYGDRPEYARRILSLDLGIRMSRASLEFWEEVAEREGRPLAA